MDKRLYITMNADRKVSGILRGYDPFTNLVLDESYDHSANDRVAIGNIVSCIPKASISLPKGHSRKQHHKSRAY